MNPSILPSKEIKIWPVWRSVEVGTFRDAQSMMDAIEGARMYISGCAEDTLSKITFASTKRILNLVVVTVAELGLSDDATTKEIFDSAQEKGLSLCPPEVGPQLRMQYKNQPNGECNYIAMKPIDGISGNPELFVVEFTHNDLCLFSQFHDQWSSLSRFVFVSGM